MTLPEIQQIVCMSVVLLLSLAFLSVERSVASIPLEPVGVCTTASYLRRLRALRCNQTHGQQLADMYLNCGYNQLALREMIDCGVRDGDFCFDVADYAQRYQNEVDSQCFDMYGKPICSDDCRAALKSFRENVGCCINNLYNASDNPISNDRTASNLLWTACEVEPVDGFCRSTIRYEVIYNTQVCVSDEVVYRKSRLECHPDYGQAFADLFRLCGYSAQLRHAVNICGVNSEDRYCFELQTVGNSIAEDVNKYCVKATESDCPLSCKVALDSYKRQLGCCLNNLFNDEENSYFRTTSPALWTTCQADRPRFCKTTISLGDGSSMLHISSTLLALLLLCGTILNFIV